MKKFLIVALCIITLTLSVTSCSKPPEFSEIEGRLRELIEASYGVNDLLFGEGLEVYEKVYEKEFDVFRDHQTNEVYYYYELRDETLGELVGYRDTDISFYVVSSTPISEGTLFWEKDGKSCYKIEYDDNYTVHYIRLENKKQGDEPAYSDTDGGYYYEIEYNSDGKNKTSKEYEDPNTKEKHEYFVIEDQQYGTVYEYSGKREKKVEKTTEGKNTYYYYTMSDKKYGTVYEYREQTIKYLQKLSAKKAGEEPVYSASDKYYYPVEYKEPTYEFYYSEDDPIGYSYVRADSNFLTVEQIKEYAESVYSTQYLEELYEMLFTGAVVSEDISGSLGARYYNYEDEEGQIWLMESDNYKSLIKGKRLYDFSTAKVVRPGNSKFVNIEIESYMEETSDARQTVRLSLVKQDDGKWYLDSATY